MKKILNKKGFTLIEMMVAMAIFVMFLGVLIGSYTDIVKSQQEANDYRVLYSEARRVFDKITEEVRNGAIYYKNIDYRSDNQSLVLISMDGDRHVVFEYDEDEENIWFGEDILEEQIRKQTDYLLISPDNDRISVTEFNVFVSPVDDPYKLENTFNDGLQFQPKVTVFATFEMERRKGGTPYSVDLQTTVSSRSYSTLPTIDIVTSFDFN
ncbi:MAG: prepilin-type N-terminal cleavage/methylation domain-containing protein [Nitrospirae bacterium]|nr:prepilin-type N-terminal cleavage/methylation domain-containing protein [Nitrospirota bacterium]